MTRIRPATATKMSAAAIGKFKILGTLGTGAHSTILHVLREADSKPYALKVVPINGADDQKFLEQAQHEFRVAQMLDHPSLIKIHAFETVRDWLFRTRKVHLLIDYVPGQTLDTLKRLPPAELLEVLSAIAAGMVHMHRRRVCHADMKPNNVMRSRNGAVKIIDFGLAWIRGEEKHRLQGTPEFMAPEQVKKSIVNESTDIYNFGATMYRLTTFRNPPNALTATGDLHLDARTWSQLVKPVQEFNAEAPPELCALIHRCLSYNPAQRPERMSEVQETLDWIRMRLERGHQDERS